jgi:hypothetical protein
MTVNGELESIWKEDVVEYIEVLSQHLPGGSYKNHENSQV